MLLILLCSCFFVFVVYNVLSMCLGLENLIFFKMDIIVIFYYWFFGFIISGEIER